MITIHPSVFAQADWLKTIGQLETETGLIAVTGQRYATLQPVAETDCNATATQELLA